MPGCTFKQLLSSYIPTWSKQKIARLDDLNSRNETNIKAHNCFFLNIDMLF